MDRNGVARGELLDAVLDAFPSPVFVVDGDVRIVEANRAARDRFSSAAGLVDRRLCGDVLGCLHAEHGPGPCGSTEHCSECPLRDSIQVARDADRATSRRLGRVHLASQPPDEETWFLITVTALQFPGERLYLLVLEDVTELVALQQIVPMCASCRKVRNDRDYWEGVETYLHRNTRIQFSHGICPDCMRKLYPEYVRSMTDGTPPPSGTGG